MKVLYAALLLNVESTAAFAAGNQFGRDQSYANTRNVLLCAPAGLSLSLSSNKKHENIVPSLTQINERQSTELNFSSYACLRYCNNSTYYTEKLPGKYLSVKKY